MVVQQKEEDGAKRPIHKMRVILLACSAAVGGGGGATPFSLSFFFFEAQVNCVRTKDTYADRQFGPCDLTLPEISVFSKRPLTNRRKCWFEFIYLSGSAGSCVSHIKVSQPSLPCHLTIVIVLFSTRYTQLSLCKRKENYIMIGNIKRKDFLFFKSSL